MEDGEKDGLPNGEDQDDQGNEAGAVVGSSAGSKKRLTRRRIYLQRLIGDNLLTPQKGAARYTSKRLVVRFLAYLIVATVVIISRSNVGDLFDQTNAITQALEKTQWLAPDKQPRYFADIKTVDDIQAWLQQVLLTKILGQGPSTLRRNLTLLSYNRVTPSMGVCSDSATLSVTLRKAAVTTDGQRTTTRRFSQLYPRTKVVESIEAGAPEDPVGEDERDIIGHPTPVKWRYSRGAGFLNAGGYWATVALNDADGGWIHLRDPDAPLSYNDSQSACGIRSSGALKLSVDDDLITWGNFFDEYFASLAVAFVLYNANLQTLSRVSVTFSSNYAGQIVKSQVNSEVISMDLYAPRLRYIDMIYFLCTIFYLADCLMSFRKNFPRSLGDAGNWINLISILMSITSLVLWYNYEPMMTKAMTGSTFLDNDEAIKHRYDMLKYWRRAAGIAGLTIYLRLLYYLGMVYPRVDLLMRTLKAGAGKIMTYLSYILVIFWGFVAFAQMYFVTFSPEFSDATSTAFSLLLAFFGDSSKLATVDANAARLKSVFYVPFMLFFYFISQNMFNAIVNYAYNRVSEEMEPQFEHEKRARKRRAAQLKASGHKTFPQVLRDRFAAVFGERMLPAFLQGTTSAAQGSSPEGAEKAEKGGAPAPQHIENEDPEIKAMVENYLAADKNSKSQDGAMNACLFFVFAGCYVWFLFANLSVGDNHQVYTAMSNVVTGLDIANYYWDEAAQKWLPDGTFIKFNDIDTVLQLGDWLQYALPEIIFQTVPSTTKARSVAAGLYDKSAICIKGWNCLLQMAQDLVDGGDNFTFTDGPKLLRMTQRRARTKPNTGRTADDTPDNYAFSGGIDNSRTKMPMAQAMAPLRSAKQIDPYSPPDGMYEDTTDIQLSDKLQTVCSVAPPGDHRAFRDYGGIVCYLDADYDKFQYQLEIILTNGFLSPATSTLVIDFAMQNSNKELLSYVLISFVVQPSGRLDKELKVLPVKLFNFPDWVNKIPAILTRLLPGVFYMLLTLRFLKQLKDDFSKEFLRRKLKSQAESGSAMSADRLGLLFHTLLHFFQNDVFNILEVVSVFISIFSMALFFIWLVQDSRLTETTAGQFSDFLYSLDDLTRGAGLYNRLSAFNVLLIAVRPVKFVRENPRMAKLLQTLGEATQDIFVFVVMIFVTIAGFVMFSYVCFGPDLEATSTPINALIFCFKYVHGEFSLPDLLDVDPIMGAVMFLYLIIVVCVFANIFFAIIDRHFVTADPPPIQWRLKLKPIFGRMCRCIEWDVDYVMEQDPNAEKKQGPPSRRFKVKQFQEKIQDIMSNLNAAAGSKGQGRSKDISEVCDIDDRLDTAVVWARDEAQRLANKLVDLSAKKQSDQNDDHFVKMEVMGKFVQEETRVTKAEMEEAERQMRYATQVYESTCMSDQETLAKYIIMLERKIRKHMVEMENLQVEVEHLEQQTDTLRHNPGERFHLGEAPDYGNLAQDGAGGTGEPAEGTEEARRAAAAKPPPIQLEDDAEQEAVEPVPGSALNSARSVESNDPTLPKVMTAEPRQESIHVRRGLWEALGAHRARGT